jgi:hypothetical protein
MKTLAAFVLLCLLEALPASANPSALPQELRAELADAQLAGRAKLKVLGFQIYDAALWVAPGFKSKAFPEHAFALELAYLRKVSNEDIASRSIEEMRRFATLSPEQDAKWSKQMREIFPTVQAGDRLTGFHRPGIGASFHFNGKFKGEIRDPEFARLFFGIWLFEATAKPSVRQALLAMLTE